jgi:hypothetical protein
MTAVTEPHRERVVGAFLVAFAVGVTAPLPAVVPAAPGSGVLAASAGVAVGVALVVAVGVKQAEGLLESLAPVRYLLGPGVVLVAWTLAAFVVAPPPRPVALAPFAVASAGCVFGVAAWVLARDAVDRVRRDAATTLVAFEAPHPPRVRRAMRLGGVLATLSAGVSAVATALSGDLELSVAFAPLVTTGIVFLAFSRLEREVRVTEAGLYVQRSRRDWADFEGVRVADDVLVVDGRTWRTGTLRFDATEIEDVEGAVAAMRARIEAATAPGGKEGDASAGGEEDASAAVECGQSSPDS